MKKLFTLTILGIAIAISGKSQNQPNINQTLKQELANSGFADAEKTEVQLSSSYTTKHNGITHYYGNQTVNGQVVFNAYFDLHLNSQGKPVAMHHNLVSQSTIETSGKGFKLSEVQALEKALNTKGLNGSLSAGMKKGILENGKSVYLNPAISDEKMYVRSGFQFNGEKLAPAFEVEFYELETNDWWNVVIDAGTGAVLNSTTYTAHCDPNQIYHSGTKSYKFEEELTVGAKSLGKKSSTGTYYALALPWESPNHSQLGLQTNAHWPVASPFGWHDTNGVAGHEFTITRGNNVYAKEDTLANNGNGYSPSGGDSLFFDFPFSVDARPRANLNAAITNLFYMNNVLHDVLFAYGFDEEAGNFQQKNYSGKGRQGDPVMADAQDGSGTSNANFSTPNDGSSGRMQMFLWPTDAAASTSNTLAILHPATIDGIYFGAPSVAGPRLNEIGLGGQLILVKDSGATTNNGCGAIENLSQLNGKIAVVDRGGPCGTTGSANRTKIKKLQAAGAIAVIIAHNTSGITPTPVNGTDNTITIPSITISFGTGVAIKSTIASDSIYAVLFDSSAFSTARIYDSDFDNGVIAHELGHGVSNRLTGGPLNSNCLNNQEQAGEGWSDFFALAFTTRSWEKDNNLSRGIGTFLIDEDTTGLGIRPYRYSRSMTVNPVNYNSAKTLSVPHGVGFVFCSMLYDIFWDMIDKYGFDPDLYNGDGGNNKTIQLVIDGLKLQKCQPGFIDSRDAILLADSLNNGGANKDLLWKAFARRGLGYSASQGLSTSRSDGTQAFDLPPVAGLNSEVFNYNFSVYPNPTSGSITVDVFGGNKLEKTEVYDISGKLVFAQENSSGSFNSDDLELNLPQGYYLVKVYSNQGTSTKKLVIK